jgi:hypothetical protein
VGKLSDKFFDELQEEFYAKTGQRSTVKKPSSEPSERAESHAPAAEPAEGSARDDREDSSADMPAKVGTPTPTDIPAEAGTPAEPAAQHGNVVEVTSAEWNGKREPAVAEARRDAAAQATLPQPAVTPTVATRAETGQVIGGLQFAAFPSYPLAPIPDGNLPTEDAHQAARAHMEWLAAITGPKSFAINSLQPECAAVQALRNSFGGAQIAGQSPQPNPR